MELIVHSGRKTDVITFEQKTNLLALLQARGYSVSARCGGNGTCGKCGVKLLSGALCGEEKAGVYLSCKAEIEADAEIEIYETAGGGLTDGAANAAVTDGEEGFGVALDLGTTTLAFALVRLKTGEILGKKSCLNPQGTYGADVISRIKAADEGNGAALAACVKEKVNETLSEFCAEHRLGGIKRLCVAANTTMLHLFVGADASGIGKAPFTPSFLQTQYMRGGDEGIDSEEVVLLPSAHSFVGSDAICGAYYTRAAERGACALLDIGTNGEIVLFSGGEIVCTSTAAGPALEGANIECGTGGVAGAIDSVKRENGAIVCTTVGGGAPSGICGSGLVDAVAVMLDEGVIDETGAFETGEKFDVAGGVYVSQKDVREFQLAKSAIAAGLSALLARAGTERLDTLLIAGGLGFYLDEKSARRTGLLEDVADKTEIVGNASLGGAAQCLCSAAALKACEALAQRASYIDLSADAVFMEKYMEKMYF
ncbi:MAG: hypothetical protein DBX59_02190 [Bacillota bacterium]|nr:MAG: hypothetical protein DBX59_02190 [Bacillota bacterium]